MIFNSYSIFNFRDLFFFFLFQNLVQLLYYLYYTVRSY